MYYIIIIGRMTSYGISNPFLSSIWDSNDAEELEVTAPTTSLESW